MQRLLSLAAKRRAADAALRLSVRGGCLSLAGGGLLRRRCHCPCRIPAPCLLLDNQAVQNFLDHRLFLGRQLADCLELQAQLVVVAYGHVVCSHAAIRHSKNHAHAKARSTRRKTNSRGPSPPPSVSLEPPQEFCAPSALLAAVQAETSGV